MALNLGDTALDNLYLGDSIIRRAYLGTDLVYDKPAYVDEPKVDPTHPLANRTVVTRLELGELQGMTADANYAVVDQAYASATADTLAFAKEALPTTPTPTTMRIDALIKADKTAGRYSYVGFSGNANPANNTGAVIVGHEAGQGIRIHSVGFILTGFTLLTEANVVDGAWYRVSLSWDNSMSRGATKARINGYVEPDGSRLPETIHLGNTDRTLNPTTYPPAAIVARTNSPLGTIRDLRYVDSMLGVSDGDTPIYTMPKMGDGATATDKAVIYSKPKAAPLRIVITAGGSGVYGGADDWGHGTGRNGHPWDAFRRFWRDLSHLGYTVLHTQALHEGWGADDHLAKQLEALDIVRNEFATDSRLYYLGYSMGGASVWRALMGRAGFPPIRAAYLVAGIADISMYYDNASYPQLKTRWPDRTLIDDPVDFDPAELVARGTRVRMITSDADTNVAKAVHHDPMRDKYLNNGGASLFSELVHTGVGHFDPAYWDAQDCVDFFEGADL